MSKPRKLPSGSWNVQVYEGKDPSGKKIFTSFTAPTAAEAEFLAAEYKTGRAKKKAPPSELSVGDVVDRYIELSREALSPTTIRGYEVIRHSGLPDLMPVLVSSLSPELVQEAINEECHRVNERTGRVISPKTVHSEWGLVQTALKELCSLSFAPKLPRYHRPPKEYPDPAAVVAALRGSDVELPCLLSLMLSLSLSEIMGLTCSSVHDGCVYVRQVSVKLNHGEVIKATGKVATRLRKLSVPPYLMSLINSSPPMQNYAQTGADGRLMAWSRDWIYKRWQKICSEHGWRLTFHDLRHLNASVMLLLGVPEKYAMERGGWSTPHVMKSVYQHTFSSERDRVDARINDYFEALVDGSDRHLFAQKSE